MSNFPSYHILITGNSIKLDVGFIGISNCTLIKTADGPILFDVGGTVTRDALIKALREIGMKPSDITKVFLSHLHADHSLNIDLFHPSTHVFLSRAEWDYASKPHPDDIYIPWCIHEQLKKYNLHLIEGSDELSAGVRYFPAPGHTPGCYAIALSVENGSTVTVAGDAVKYPREVLRRRADICFGTQEDSAASIETILRQSDHIIPGHYSPFYKENGTFLWDQPQQISLVIR